MNNRTFIALFGFLGMALVAFLGFAAEQKAEDKGKKSKGAPPLVVDKEAPLLLEEPSKDEKKVQEVAENVACFVCHVNYQEEPLVVLHAAGEIGCVDCHGKSFAHRNDENNTTPPDHMYPAEKIDKSCKMCHKSHDAPAEKVIGLWLKRCPEKRDPKAIICTDCHGKHRLKIRSVRWDKKTGKLLPNKKGKPKGAPQKKSG